MSEKRRDSVSYRKLLVVIIVICIVLIMALRCAMLITIHKVLEADELVAPKGLSPRDKGEPSQKPSKLVPKPRLPQWEL